MSDRALHGAAALVAALVPSAAWALPWNTDMVDSQSVKAYEAVMAPLPDGVVSQPNLLTPIAWRPRYTWASGVADSLTSPLDASDAAVLATGERMWNVYCWPCHGNTEQIGPVGQRWPVVPRILPPGDEATAWDDRLTRLSDGHVYMTILNGSLSGLMHPYNYAMTSDEMWSVVAWLRTHPKIANPSAKAPAAPSPTPGGAGEAPVPGGM